MKKKMTKTNSTISKIHKTKYKFIGEQHGTPKRIRGLGGVSILC